MALRDRRPNLLVRHADLFREVTRRVKTRYPFRIEAMVLMPEHWYAVWTLPEGDADYSLRVRLIKSGIVQALRARGMPIARNERGEASVWQRRFWEHRIRDDPDFLRHVDYTHFNPVKHGYVARAGDWPYSSIHRHVHEESILCGWGQT